MLLSTAVDFTYFLTKTGPAQIQGSDLVYMETTIYPSWFKSMRLEWVPLKSWESKNPRYNVYRSDTEVDNYELLTSSPIEETFFVDDGTWDSSKFAKEFWVIEAVLNDGSVYRTAPHNVKGHNRTFQQLAATEINRREWILLSKFSGMDATILRRKSHGMRCTNCWDPTTRRTVKNNCTHCYGVGFEGGFYKGYTTKIQFDARIENQQYAYFGKFEANQIGAWAIAFPDINPNDIIIRHGDWKVYRVEQIQNTELLSNTVRQIMRLTELAKEGIEYGLIEREGLLTRTVNGINQ